MSEFPQVSPSVSSGPQSAERPTPPRAAAIVDDLLRAAHRLRGLLANHFAEFGLTDVRYAVLQFVNRSAPQGCSQAELATELAQSESSVCTLVERMRHSGLLYRLRSKADRRKRVLMLTEQGRQVLDAVEQCHGERTTALLSGLSDEQLETLARLLDLLVEELSQPASSEADEKPLVMPANVFGLRAAEGESPAERHTPAA